jgi:hypothetical protein
MGPDRGYEAIKGRIADRLLQHGASTREVDRWAFMLADLWDECSEIRQALESFSQSDGSGALLAVISGLETFRVDSVAYDRVARRVYQRFAGMVYTSKHSELKSIKGMLTTWWQDDAKLKAIAEDIAGLRRLSDELGVMLSDRYLLELTTRPRRRAAVARLRKLVSGVESLARNLGTALEEEND